MDRGAESVMVVGGRYQELFASLGLTPAGVFSDPRIVVWRSITERENCTLDVSDGRRFHVKRFHAAKAVRGASPAEEEARGIRLLEQNAIPTSALAAWGKLTDGRSFLITEDLAGFRAADKLISEGLPFARLSAATADLAGELHQQRLHHRDLYLCHFFVRVQGEALELRLIDAARVRRLPGFLTRRRWVVKDLAQFWYSTIALGVTEAERVEWLERYARRRGLTSTAGLARSVRRKVSAITRHDRRLRAAQPTRNVSIPGA